MSLFGDDEGETDGGTLTTKTALRGGSRTYEEGSGFMRWWREGHVGIVVFFERFGFDYGDFFWHGVI